MLKLQRIYIKDSEWRNEKQSIVARKTDKMMDYRYIPWLSLPLKSPDGAGSGREKKKLAKPQRPQRTRQGK